MEDTEFDLSTIERLIRLVDSRDLAELVVEDETIKITVRGASYAPKTYAAPLVQASSNGAASDESPEDYIAAAPGAGSPVPAIESAPRLAVASPMVGVFYRSSGPDSSPYVEVGEHVSVGQIIGLIEAMKVFSEVPSEVSGTVVAFASPNGQLVRTGDPLIYLSPD